MKVGWDLPPFPTHSQAQSSSNRFPNFFFWKGPSCAQLELQKSPFLATVELSDV